MNENPGREMEIVHSARDQIHAQNTAGLEIAASNMCGAQVIAAEIEEQTLALDKTTAEILEEILDSIIFSADQISDSIDLLGDRLCIELSEIKWQLTQRVKTLDKILEVLNQNRKNEARQLVQQGLRHYINGEFEEAEERFRLALDFDTTDYQVLMNLAFIEIHKGNPSQAFNFFKKALSLPENLDPVCTARTLWAIARLHYAEKDFDRAYTYSEEALKHEKQNDPGVFYKSGVYAAFAGKKSAALEKIERAILIDFSYFSKSSVDPDLQSIKQDIIELLDRLSVDAEFKATQLLKKVEYNLVSLENEGELENKDTFVDEIRKIVNCAIAGLRKPSYSFCCHCISVMNKIQEVLSQIKNMVPLYSKLRKSQENYDKNNMSFSSKKQQAEPSTGFPPFVYLIMIFISYILPGFLLANAGSSEDGIPWAILFFIWPLWIILDFFWSHADISATVAGGLKGLFLAGIMWVMVSFRKKILGIKYNRINRDLSFSGQQFYEAKRTLLYIQNEITSKHNTIRDQISRARL